ncbi:MAG TPA: hypothetical protein VGW11_05220 [Solirubrobacteraceae bacterium]|nr:hypothetical protein [Solirubrobacteraceae bacterium]
MRLSPLGIVLLALLVLTVLPAAALADGQAVINDCSDNEQIDGDYSQKEYNQALDELPADIDGYSPCRDVITRARDDAASGGGKGPRGGLPASGGNSGADFGGIGGSFFGGSDSAALPGTPAGPPNTGDPLENALADVPQAERDLLDQARGGDETGSFLDGAAVRPEVAGRAPELASVSRLPTPVLVLLVLVAGALCLLCGNLVRRRVLGHRGA